MLLRAPPAPDAPWWQPCKATSMGMDPHRHAGPCQMGMGEAMRPGRESMAQQRIPKCRARCQRAQQQLLRCQGTGPAQARPACSKERGSATMLGVRKLSTGRQAPRATVSWSLTKLKQGRHATCSPKRSGSSWSAHEVGVAGHRVGDSCTKVMTPGCNLLRRRGAVRSWKMMVLSNATSV